MLGRPSRPKGIGADFVKFFDLNPSLEFAALWLEPCSLIQEPLGHISTVIAPEAHLVASRP